MYKIDCSLLLHFSDAHLGIRSDSEVRLDVCRKAFDTILYIVEKLGIKHIIFEGDMFHSRTSINVNTINVAFELMEKLSKSAEVFMIVGNHDTHFKNKTDIHSVKMFHNLKNVHIIDTPTEVLINNSHRMLLVPWNMNLEAFENNAYDTVCGHFDFSSKYLISSYIEEHVSGENSDDSLLSDLLKDGVDSYIDNADDGFNVEDIKDVVTKKGELNSTSYIGNFVDKCKPGGYVFSGHIHSRKEFQVRGRNFIFTGSPFQQTFGDIGKTYGFYLQDVKANKLKFIENKKAPVHVIIKTSNIKEDFSYSICTGNYVKLIVDTSLKYDEIATITNTIAENTPLEISPVEYTVMINNDIPDLNPDECDISNAKKNYIFEFITGLSDEEIEAKKLSKERLLKIANTYFDTAKEKMEEEEVA